MCLTTSLNGWSFLKLALLVHGWCLFFRLISTCWRLAGAYFLRLISTCWCLAGAYFFRLISTCWCFAWNQLLCTKLSQKMKPIKWPNFKTTIGIKYLHRKKHIWMEWNKALLRNTFAARLLPAFFHSPSNYFQMVLKHLP